MAYLIHSITGNPATTREDVRKFFEILAMIVYRSWYVSMEFVVCIHGMLSKFYELSHMNFLGLLGCPLTSFAQAPSARG